MSTQTGDTATNGENGRRDGDWKDLVAAAVASATLGSALIYGLVALGYSQFYRELGMTPRDVGIEAGKTVGDAAGLAITLTLASGVAALVLYGFARLLRFSWMRRRPETRDQEPTYKRVWRPEIGRWLEARSRVKQFRDIFIATSAAALVATAVGVRYIADTRADDVKTGRPVQPVRFGPELLSPLEVLAIRADPVIAVEPLRRDEDRLPSTLREAMVDGDLFYLGRSAGSGAFYDADLQRHFVLPLTSFAIELSNCETWRNTDPECD